MSERPQEEIILPQIGKRYTYRDAEEGKPLEWKHVAFIRAQHKHLPTVMDGELIERTPYAEKVSFRQTVHFTLNHLVSSHALGNWSESRCVVIAPGEAMKEINGTPRVMNAVDSFYDRRDVVWPPGTIIVYFVGDDDAEALRQQFGAKYHFVRLEKDADIKYEVTDILKQLGYQPIEGGETYANDTWFDGAVADLGRREGAVLTSHQYSDEGRRDQYFAIEAWRFFPQPDERAAVLRNGVLCLDDLLNDPVLHEEDREHLIRIVLETVLMTHSRALDEYEHVSKIEQAGLELRAMWHLVIYNKLLQLATPRTEWSSDTKNVHAILSRFPNEYWEMLLHDFDQPWIMERLESPSFLLSGAASFRPPQGTKREALFQKVKNDFSYVRQGLENLLGEEQTAAVLRMLPSDFVDLQKVPSQECRELEIEL